MKYAHMRFSRRLLSDAEDGNSLFFPFGKFSLAVKLLNGMLNADDPNKTEYSPKRKSFAG
jgi:hypothetical protein